MSRKFMTLGDAVVSQKPTEAADHFDDIAEREMHEIMTMQPYDNNTSELFKDYTPAGSKLTDIKRPDEAHQGSHVQHLKHRR